MSPTTAMMDTSHLGMVIEYANLIVDGVGLPRDAFLVSQSGTVNEADRIRVNVNAIIMTFFH